jgi:hypothetical protein
MRYLFLFSIKGESHREKRELDESSLFSKKLVGPRAWTRPAASPGDRASYQNGWR